MWGIVMRGFNSIWCYICTCRPGPLEVFQLVQDDVLWGFVDDKIRFVDLRHDKDYS